MGHWRAGWSSWRGGQERCGSWLPWEVECGRRRGGCVEGGKARWWSLMAACLSAAAGGHGGAGFFESGQGGLCADSRHVCPGRGMRGDGSLQNAKEVAALPDTTHRRSVMSQGPGAGRSSTSVADRPRLKQSLRRGPSTSRWGNKARWRAAPDQLAAPPRAPGDQSAQRPKH